MTEAWENRLLFVLSYDRQFGKKYDGNFARYNWSQETLALNAGLDRTFVGAIERAERNITLATAEKLAKAFNLSVADLIAGQNTAALLKAMRAKDSD